jgi:hypothetical protein
MKTAIKSKKWEAEKLDKHIIKLTFCKQEGKVDAKVIKDSYEDAFSLVDSNLKYIYVVTGKYTLLTKEAQKQVGLEGKRWDKQAILIHNLAQRIMGNFVMNRIKGDNRMRLFTKEKDLLDWLEENNN